MHCKNCEPRNNCNFIKNKYGYCCYFIEPYPYIFNLYVYKEFRCKGVATDILNKCINRIRENGCLGDIKIEAEPQENSIQKERLIKFYSSLGLLVIK